MIVSGCIGGCTVFNCGFADNDSSAAHSHAIAPDFTAQETSFRQVIDPRWSRISALFLFVFKLDKAR